MTHCSQSSIHEDVTEEELENITETEAANTETPNSSPSVGCGKTVPNTNPGKAKYKKQKNPSGDENDDDCTDDNRDSKRQKTEAASLFYSEEKRKFACPYRKHSPHKYRASNRKWRSCALTPLDSVARVK